MKSLSVIIPCYNESETIEKITRALLDVLENNSEEIDFEIIIVDDGSTDGSLEKALFLQNQFSSLKVFHTI